MISGSGLSYENCSAIIESIATIKANQHRNVSYYGPEDIKQEVRVKCWLSLPKYDPDRFGTDLKVFLSICAENRIRDIKRSTIYKHNKPCFSCPFWMEQAANSGVHDCCIFADKMHCVKYSRHEKYVQVKLSANHPVDIDGHRIEDFKFKNSISSIDILDFINQHLSKQLYPLFVIFYNNNFDVKCLKKPERELLFSGLKTILSNSSFME